MNEGFGKLHFEFGTKAGAGAERAGDEGGTLKIAFLGNFSGSDNRGTSASSGATKTRRIDCDSIHAFFAGLGAILKLKLADGAETNLRFKQIDDFHPERLMRLAPELRATFRTGESSAAATASPATVPITFRRE